ncbi:MAG: hypothetical protein P4M12_05460 [Gammaproteobacteria bacterium]|nr:hypothetical protein [Gammaproteobacteria bacterium]
MFWLNRLGIPVGHFALLLGTILLLNSIGLLLWKKPLFPTKYYLPFAGIFFFALCLVGFSLLRYGFDWVSFGNDDMTNYALGAARFLDHGFFQIPNTTDLIQRKDFSLLFWFWQVPDMIRPGSELILAWVSGCTHLNPLQIFMPVIVSFHLILISTTGALVYLSRRNYSIALVTCLVLSCSALTVLGTLSQLITQVIGLSLLMTSIILICQPFTTHNKFNGIKQGLLIAIILSVLLMMYMELIPFLVISSIIYFIINTWKGWRPNKIFFHTFLSSIIFIIFFLNIHLLAIFEFFIREYKVTSESAVLQVALFPYFLLPSGLGNLWGFAGLMVEKAELFMCADIICGALLTLFVISATIKLILGRASLPAITAFVMLVLGFDFFIKQYGFGLFKLSMYIQPFLISVLVMSVFERIKNDYLRNLFFLVLIMSGYGAISFYLDRGKSVTPGLFSEIPYGSSSKINQEYRNLISGLPKDTLLLSDDFNISIIKSQALQSIHHRFIPLTSPSNFIVGAMSDDLYLMPAVHSKLFYGAKAKKIADTYFSESFYSDSFNLHDAHHSLINFTENEFCNNKNDCSNGFIIADTSLRSVFNRRYSTIESQHNFTLKKLSEVSNHLVFIDSTLGRVYHSVIDSNMKNLSLFNLENDYFYPDKSMQSVGRYLLMKVFNPGQKFRMEIALTNSFNGDGLNKLPQVTAVGKTRVSFPVMGSGSARVFSELFSPQMIEGKSYVATDMNADGVLFPSHRKGIMNLFNKNLNLDTRQVVTFVRNLSLISEEDYQNLNSPASIKEFPKDLANNDLEYSGIFEDGWISRDSFFQLKQPKLNSELIIQGMIPQIDKQFAGSTLTILVDGKKISESKLKTGNFDVTVPVISSFSKHKVEFHFSEGQKLPGGDNRPIGAQIKFIGFI